jgi:DNA-binding transcriptional MocR family regulator
MRPDLLTEAIERPARAVFLQPRGQNPTGVTLTPRRARALAAALGNSDTLVVEDDSTGAIATSPPISLGLWLPDRTVPMRSFSKSHGPDLRLAAMSGPGALMDEILARRQLGQGWSSRLVQRILLHLLTDPGSVAEVEHAREVYADRRRLLVEALGRRGVEVGGVEGLNIWVPVLDEPAALVRLATQGIGVAPGAPFLVLPERSGHVRVTAGLVTEDRDVVADALAAAAQLAPWGPPG